METETPATTFSSDTTETAWSTDAVLARIKAWRAEGRSIGFTNGCFDILHPGHVSLMRQARAACDRLVVGLNSDASVRRLKGPNRPLNDANSRAIVLAALAYQTSLVVWQLVPVPEAAAVSAAAG